MISVAYALLLISLVFGTVPEVWAAPVGSRSVHVKTMRLIPFEKEHMRRVHHSAVSVVQRDDVHVASTVASMAPAVTPVLVAARKVPPSSSKSARMVARHENHQLGNPKSDTATPERKRFTRRHHAKNEARGSSSAAPRAVPRFQRDEVERRSGNKDNEKRKNYANDANVAREPMDAQKKPLVVKMTEKRESEMNKARKLASQPTPVRPIAMFRRALAFEDLD